MARPLRSTGITRFIATTRQSAPDRCFGTFGLAGHPLAPFPLAPPNSFSSSAPEPRPESRLLYPGHHMDGNQVSSMLFPEKMSLPGFDVICVHFEAYPEVHLRSSLWTPHDVIASRLFRNVHHLGHWAEAAYGCLKPAPESRLRRTYLHLSVQHGALQKKRVLLDTRHSALSRASSRHPSSAARRAYGRAMLILQTVLPRLLGLPSAHSAAAGRRPHSGFPVALAG